MRGTGHSAKEERKAGGHQNYGTKQEQQRTSTHSCNSYIAKLPYCGSKCCTVAANLTPKRYFKYLDCGVSSKEWGKMSSFESCSFSLSLSLLFRPHSLSCEINVFPAVCGSYSSLPISRCNISHRLPLPVSTKSPLILAVVVAVTVVCT